ncbi:DUF4012 domain-containing protein [Arthrobacter sp. HMWF013]|uniref:DUF4012 domain-containing protein n=1 Tax=Arthrobacter sp. HMWF013 TaxID=2056849 RepID=UPI000D360B08|nr:DUF4012 domain-containing protein [Arthrobacter sp. HMWF013]PTT65279.1 hypothetical protein DBR22_12820 [Arthrobacter sp. HMWF013]
MKAESPETQRESHSRRSPSSRRNPRRRRFAAAGTVVGLAVVFSSIFVALLAATAQTIESELQASQDLLPRISDNIQLGDAASLGPLAEKLKEHTSKARAASQSPIWTIAGTAPWMGHNFQAVAEVATAADDVANLGLGPLVSVFESFDFSSLVPRDGAISLSDISKSQPVIASAAYAVRSSAERLHNIQTTDLLHQISEPIVEARQSLDSTSAGLDAAATAATLVPSMLGEDSPREYLLMIQNNAESRASGGIPGALAILRVEDGRLSLGQQTGTGGIGVMSPALTVEPEQLQIYSSRMGKFVQDVNLTPDFPTAASTAQAMWEHESGERVDGVISIDPIALGYVLQATGPVKIASPELLALASRGLPTELTGNNVVQTLLSDVYARIEQPVQQDAYFAGVSQEVFSALSSGQGDSKGLLEGLTKAAKEGRVLIWSGWKDEQAQIERYPLSGSISGPSVSPAQFGIYFNDGTGAKMDYYVKRTVQLFEECPKDGYAQTTVRVTSTNTAPVDSASSLPSYVTGAGIFGVPPGHVQTNITAYGPAQALVETAQLDGQKTEFAPYIHSNRPVGVVAIRLAPGESRTVEFTFSKIVQHTVPNVVVTPSVQDVKDVILPTMPASCGQ